MKNIAEYIKDKYGPWGWMGQRAHDAAGINSILPLDFILSCDHGLDTGVFFREKDVFSVEKTSGIRKNWSNEDLNYSLHGDLGRDVFDRWNTCSGRVSLLCYRSVEMLENEIEGLNVPPRLLAVPEKMKRHFDNKVMFYEMLGKMLLRRIPGRVTVLAGEDYAVLADELGLPFVIQFPYGSSGHFTFFITCENEFRSLRVKYPSNKVIVTEYVEGFSLNVNAMVVSRENGPEVFSSFPSVQITGNPECGNSPLAFCGNDFSSARGLDKDVITQVDRSVKATGMWMAAKGYRGIFGMDFIVSGGTVYPVEINPRFQNSTSFVSAVKSTPAGGEATLFLLHIAEFLQTGDDILREYIRGFSFDTLMEPIEGSQIVLHNRMERTVVTGTLLPGIYSFENGTLKFKREGALISVCENKDDILVTCGVPEKGTELEPNAPLCKVQMPRSVLDPGNKKDFTERTRSILKAVYSGFALERLTLKV